MNDKQLQLVAQCKEVAAMAEIIAKVHHDLASVYGSHPQSESFTDMVGRFTHSRMEQLGDMMNNMDIVEPADAERSGPIFEGARLLFPINPEQ